LNFIPLVPQWLAWTFGGLLIAAALQDAMRLKISNITCGLVLLGGIVAALMIGFYVDMWQNLAVFAVLLAIGTPLFAAGKLGGGDVKLFAATGLWFAFDGALRMAITVLLMGGLLAIVIVTLRHFSWSDKARERAIILRPRAGIPYAVAIAAGGLLTILVQRA
jgi:prepilin peptidase CpaA